MPDDTADQPSVEQNGRRPLSYYKAIEFSPEQHPRRLVFVAEHGAPKAPEDVVNLRRDFEKTARVVVALFDDQEDIRDDIFSLMHKAADRGLRGSNFNVYDGRSNLLEVQDTINEYALRVRDKHLWEYTKLLCYFGVIPLLVGAAVFLTGGLGLLSRPAPGHDYDPLFVWILAACWITAGATFCVWAEFALRMQAGLTYDQLLYLDPSRWRPRQRLLVTIVISFIFAFLLAYDAIEVGIGGLLLNKFATTTPALALAVGGVTGLAFAAVQDVIFRIRPTIQSQ